MVARGIGTAVLLESTAQLRVPSSTAYVKGIHAARFLLIILRARQTSQTSQPSLTVVVPQPLQTIDVLSLSSISQLKLGRILLTCRLLRTAR